MMIQRTGALIFDETADRYDIRFDKGGRKVAIGAYKLSQKVVGFN